MKTQRLTSVMVKTALYTKARHQFIEGPLNFQEFVNRCLSLFVHDTDDNSFSVLLLNSPYTGSEIEA